MGESTLQVNLLGTFSVSLKDATVADDAWRLRKAKALIKLLALAPERRLHADLAAEALWPGRDPGSGRNNLHQAIFSARRAIDSLGLEGHRYLEMGEDLIVLAPEIRWRSTSSPSSRRRPGRAARAPPRRTARPSTPTAANSCPRIATRSGRRPAARPCGSCASGWRSGSPSSRRAPTPARRSGASARPWSRRRSTSRPTAP